MLVIDVGVFHACHYLTFAFKFSWGLLAPIL